MMKRTRAAVAIAGVSCVFLIAGCSNGATAPTGEGGSDVDFGECEITSERGSIELDLAKEDVVTAGAILPNPGWWNGTSPSNVKSGYEYCLTAEIANMAGANRVEITPLSWDQFISGSSTGWDMVLNSVTITDERKELFDFSSPYFRSNLGIAIRADDDIDEGNLLEQRFGVLQGNMGAIYAQETLGLKPQVFQNQNDVVTALQAGQIDVFFTDTALALTFTKASEGALKVVGQIELDQGIGAVTPKGSPNSAAVDQAIRKLEADGVLDRLAETYLAPEFGVDPNSIPIWKVEP